ncbi:hypothetical protein RJ639_044331 [Escallonia herrerae]|uniref:Uncharacterized protein n=1 Tax=Escallonia herrerae TaxID=1293975 RepID=A0AA88WCC0_9ASTE|nr:hypothetical protein RJ639_044331 [Escallonia herrerae]
MSPLPTFIKEDIGSGDFGITRIVRAFGARSVSSVTRALEPETAASALRSAESQSVSQSLASFHLALHCSLTTIL